MAENKVQGLTIGLMRRTSLISRRWLADVLDLPNSSVDDGRMTRGSKRER